MRILVLAPQPFFQTRGTPIAVRALLEVLSARDYDITVLTYPEGEDVNIPNCHVQRIPSIPGVRRLRPGFSLKKLAYDAVMLPVALASIRSGRFDLIHAVEESVFMAALGKLLFGVPYVYDMDSSLAQQMEERLPSLVVLRTLMQRIEGFAVKQSLAVVGVCRALVDTAVRYAPNKLVSCVEDFSLLENERYPVEDLAQVVGGRQPIVLYVGNLEPYQGIDLLLEGFAQTTGQVPSAQLVIIGGATEDVAHYQGRAAALGIGNRVHFLGPRPVVAIGSYLSQATVLVSPRVKGRNTPMKVYSYLDSGTPLLATRLPTHAQVLDDGIALLADAHPVAFGAALSLLLQDATLRMRLSAAARERVRRDFTRDAFRRKMSTFYSMVERELESVVPKRVA